MLTGATGSVGAELAKALAARHVPFRAMVRTADSAAAQALAALPGAELVTGDFD